MASSRFLTSTLITSLKSSSARLPHLASSAAFQTLSPTPIFNSITKYPQRSSFFSNSSNANPGIPQINLRAFCRPFSTANKAISVGDKLPEATLSYFDKEGNLQTVSISDLSKGKKIILIAVPGAFTPTCSQKHLPGFVDKADQLRAKGVDLIACVSVNDAFVLKAWAESIGVGDKVLLLSDGNGHLTRAMGVAVDLSDKPVGLGVRSRRYSLLADDGVIKVLNLEEGGSFTISGADDMLKAL
eukprot:Gb_10278 [translate_table: standard]